MQVAIPLKAKLPRHGYNRQGIQLILSFRGLLRLLLLGTMLAYPRLPHAQKVLNKSRNMKMLIHGLLFHYPVISRLKHLQKLRPPCQSKQNTAYFLEPRLQYLVFRLTNEKIRFMLDS